MSVGAAGQGALGELFASVRLLAMDFDGVLTDNTVQVSQEGVETVRCWRSDGLGLNRLQEIGVRTIILSTEENPVVSVRAKKLKIPCKQGLRDKAAAIRETCAELNVDLSAVAFIGNDINDVPAFKLVGLPVAVADAYAEVLPYVLYRTVQPGGRGAVRELCDLIFRAQQDAVARGR